jgi:hypothetical protein
MEMIRKIKHRDSGMILIVSDTFKTDSMGKSRLAYDFRKDGDSEPLFSGDDFFCGMFTSINSDECMLCLLAFLTLKPGDTDKEYFEEYNENQLSWANSSECENFSFDVSLLENPNDNEEEYTFEQVFEELEF